MFIDVTRYGGLRILRLQVSAIAYIDECEGGAAIRLIGGETLRVNEDPAQIESRVDACFALVSTAISELAPDPGAGVITMSEVRAEFYPPAGPTLPDVALPPPAAPPAEQPKRRKANAR